MVMQFFTNFFFIILAPFLVGCVFIHEEQNRLLIKWVLGYLLIGIAIIILHAHGIDKIILFYLISLFSLLGLFLFIQKKDYQYLFNNFYNNLIIIFFVFSLVVITLLFGNNILSFFSKFKLILNYYGINKIHIIIFLLLILILGSLSFIKLNGYKYLLNILSNELFFLLCVITVVLVLCIDESFNIYFNTLTAGDSLAYFWSKSKALYYWQDLSTFKTPGYPHLGSAIWFYIISFFNGMEFTGRIFFVFLQTIIYLIFCLSYLNLNTYSLINKYLFGFLIIIFFQFLITYEMGGGYKFTSSGYMDWLVTLLPAFTYFIIISNNNFSVIDDNGKIKNIFVTLIFIAGSSLIIKVEGYVDFLIYLFSSLIIFYIFQREIFNKYNLKYLLYLIIIFLFFKNLNFYIYYINNIYYEPVQDFNIRSIISALLNNLDRIPIIFDYLKNSTDDAPTIIVPYILLIAYLSYQKKFKLCLISIIPILLYYIFIVIVYLSTPYNYEWHLSTSMNRLYYHIFIMMTLSNIIFISEILKKNK